MPPIDDLALLDGPSRDVLMLEEPEELALEGDDPRALYEALIANIQSKNIAEGLDETELNAIGQKVVREYEIDDNSRSEWKDKSRKAMDLAMQIAKEKTFPWPKASNIIYPAMTVAAVQFNARAYPAIIQGRSVVKGVVVGKDDGVPMPPEMVAQLQAIMGGGRPGAVPGPMPGLGAPGIDPGMPMQQPQGPQAQGAPPQQQIWIVQPGAKQERATRIGDHMSWQLLTEMTEWEDETDKLLLILPIVGCCFRKSFFDHSVGHNSSLLVLAENLVVNYNAKSMERAPRVTEQIQFYPYEIEEQVRAGLWIDQTYDKAQGEDEDAPVDFLEQHRWLDLDEDGYPEPYIVTVHKQSAKVARIVARYDAEGVQLDPESGRVLQIDPVHYYTKYDFIPNPDGGIYGVGFGQLLSPINEATNTALNQLFDANSLAITGGGFVGRGVSMHAGSLKFRLGEWKQINVPGSALKDAIVPFNHPGANAVGFELLKLLIESGKEVAAVKDILTGDNAAATMQPTTIIALIEQGLTMFGAIFKRVHKALENELDKLYRLNRVYLKNQAQYQVGDEWRTVSREDYERGSGVQPISNPTMVTDMQRMAKAQLLQSYQNDPHVNPIEVRKRIFKDARIEEPEKLIIEQQPPNPAILAEVAKQEAVQRDLDIKEASAKAKQISDLSTAVLNLAKADTENASAPLEWTAQYIRLLEIQMQALMAPAAGRGATQQPPQPALPPPAPGGGPTLSDLAVMPQ